MATDVDQILSHTLDFFDFRDKTVIVVGAGDGDLAAYCQLAEKVLAIDRDQGVIDRLTERIAGLQNVGHCEPRCVDFLRVPDHADVVLFEFSLHEMADPVVALLHASNLAPHTVIIDHAPTSTWAYHVDEMEKVRTAWAAVEALGPKRLVSYDTTQVFANHDELLDKIESQGARAVERASRLCAHTPIVIPMSYSLALIEAPA